MVDVSALTAMVEKRVGTSERRQERLALEEQWLTLRLFWGNRSDCDIIGGRVMSTWAPGRDPDEVRYKVNMIRANAAPTIAKILSVDADFQARPPTGQKRHRDAAEVTGKVLGHVQQVMKWARFRILWLQSAMIYGSSAAEVMWDPNIGEASRYYLDHRGSKLRVPPLLLTEEQRSEKDAALLFEDLAPGDMKFDLHSPFGFHWDTSSRADGIDGCMWVATRHFYDIDRVAEAYGRDVKDIPVVNGDSGLENMEEAIAFMSGPYGSPLFDTARPDDKRNNRTLVRKLWHRPNRAYPRGLMLVVAGTGSNAVLLNVSDIDNPWVADRSKQAHLPFIKLDWMPGDGTFWGVGAVEDALQPQYYLNKLRSSKIAFAEAHGQPSLFVDSDTGIDTDGQTTQPGAMYSKRPGSAAPTAGPTPQQPREVMDASLQAEGDLNRIMSQSSIDGGKMPGQIRSGAGIRQINAERFASLTIPAQMFVAATAGVANVALSIGKLKYVDERYYRFINEANEWAVEAFKGADIVNDIIVTAEPDISDSIAGQREELNDLLAAGFFNPQLDRATRTLLFKAAKFKTADEFVTRQTQAENSQDREIEEMIANPMKWDGGYPVMPWEDHESEANACVAFMYRPEFKALAKTEEGLRAQGLITQHWQAHAAALQQQQAAQLAMMEAAKGTPGSQGQASQPRQTSNAS